jgi:membrane-bound metal-dependent hydrolase YbcI (DUF457 family)
MTLIRTALTHPSRLCWWQWGQILGVALPALFCSLGVEQPLVWALAAHCFVDFTTQSKVTAAGKAQGNRQVVAYHAFIAGGYPGLIVGGLAGLAISVASHFLVDMTNKFGLDGPIGSALDQAAHIITLLIIWWLL